MEEKPKKNRKSKLKRVTKKIRHDAEKLQISAMHEWFMKAIGNDSNVSFENTERSKSKYDLVKTNKKKKERNIKIIW